MSNWEQTLKHGIHLAARSLRHSKRNVADVDEAEIYRIAAWELLAEAHRVLNAAYSRPPRQGYPSRSCMPESEPELSFRALVAAYLRGEALEMPETQASPARPAAYEISRAEAVMSVWNRQVELRPIGRGRNAGQTKKMIYRMVCGVRPSRVAQETGIGRGLLYNRKDQAMDLLWQKMMRAS